MTAAVLSYRAGFKGGAGDPTAGLQPTEGRPPNPSFLFVVNDTR